MTEGRRTSDQRVSAFSAPGRDCWGNEMDPIEIYPVGYYSDKRWSGSDSPLPPVDPTTRYWTYRVPNGEGGYTVKRFRQRPPKRRRKLVENGYTMQSQRSNDVIVAVKSKCPQNDNHSTGFFSSLAFGGIFHTEWTDNDDLALLGQLREKIGAEFNLAVFLGEGADALRTIADASRRITAAGKALRKGDFKRAARHLGSSKPRGRNVARSEVTHDWFAGNWLQLQYGWMPLVQDLYAAAKHLAFLQNRPVSMIVRATRNLDRGRAKPSSPVPGVWEISGKSIRKGMIKATLTHVNEAGLLGLEDPLSLVWEKLPYSFVADWIVPIGDYLSASALSRSLTGTYTMSRLDKLVVDGVSVVGQQDFSFIFPAEGWFHESASVRREIRSVLPVKLPSVKGREKIATWMHALNGAALLAQTFPRFGPR